MYQIYNIAIEDTANIPPVANIDYNIYYCEAGNPIFNYLGSTKTFAQWQALGFDAHSCVVDPDFNNTTDFIPYVYSTLRSRVVLTSLPKKSPKPTQMGNLEGNILRIA